MERNDASYRKKSSGLPDLTGCSGARARQRLKGSAIRRLGALRPTFAATDGARSGRQRYQERDDQNEAALPQEKHRNFAGTCNAIPRGKPPVTARP